MIYFSGMGTENKSKGLTAWCPFRFRHIPCYNTTGCLFANFSLRLFAFLNAFRLRILCLLNFRAFFLSTTTILPWGGGLLLENSIGATDNLAASYRAFNIACFPGVDGNSSLRFHDLRYAWGPKPLPPLQSLYRGFGGIWYRETKGVNWTISVQPSWIEGLHCCHADSWGQRMCAHDCSLLCTFRVSYADRERQLDSLYNSCVLASKLAVDA